MSKRVGHKQKLPYETRRRRIERRDDYDRVWAYELHDEQARRDEADDDALQARADRFDRDHGEDVP